MIKTGKVLAVNNNTITVFSEECIDCKGCPACSSRKPKSTTLTFECSLELFPGDFISFEISDNEFLKFSFLIYTIPLIFFFCGYFTGNYFFKSEGLKILSSFIFLAISFVFIFLYDLYIGKKFAPHNIKKIDKI